MITASPTLALCIPAYNAAGFLPRLLASAHAQSAPFDEIWVYDDASTDDTAALALSLGARVIHGERNAGCSHGKNILARASRCDWLHFHDADDELEPHFVATAHPWMLRANPPDVVLFAYRAIEDPSGARLYTRAFDNGALEQDAVACCVTEQINPFSGLYKRQAFLACGGWDEDPAVLPSEDQAGHLRMALAGLRFAADPTVTVINHIRPGSMTTGNPSRCPPAEFRLLDKNWRHLARHHHPLVARRLWKIAASAGSFLDWDTADQCVALARQIDSRAVTAGSIAFRALARFSPLTSLRLREHWVRLTRPHLRPHPQQHPPRVRSIP